MRSTLCMGSFWFNLIYRHRRIISCVLWWSIEVCIRQVRDLAIFNAAASLESCDWIYLRDIDSRIKAPLRWVEVCTSLKSLIHLVHLCQLLLHGNAVPYCLTLYLCW